MVRGRGKKEKFPRSARAVPKTMKKRHTDRKTALILLLQALG